MFALVCLTPTDIVMRRGTDGKPYESKESSIRRYEIGGEGVRCTHSAEADRPLIYTNEFVQMFLTNPPEEFRVEESIKEEDDPPPPLPPCDTEPSVA